MRVAVARAARAARARAVAPLVVLLASVLLAGCTFFEDEEADGADGSGTAAPPTFRLGGSFTQTRDDADLDEVMRLAREHGGEGVILESYPEQFEVSRLAQEDCSALRSILNRKPYLGSLGQCEQE